MVKAYIGLGSNLGNTPENLRVAKLRLAECGRVTAQSKLYHTKPWGNLDQPNFTNGVLQIETELSPRELLVKLKTMEKEIGREESVRWGPRLIDLDILTYGDEQVDEPDLKIPHLHMSVRAFVLIPLCDIDDSYKPVLDALTAEERAEVQPSKETW